MDPRKFRIGLVAQLSNSCKTFKAIRQIAKKY